MDKPVLIFSGATGLNTVSDPVRIPFQENGLSDLQVSINISIDQSFRPNSRAGTTLLQSGSFHSLYAKKNYCFVVKDAALYQVAEDGSLTGIRSNLNPNQRMAYALAGARCYYSNGFDYGYIYQETSYVWSKGTYTGPTTTRQFSGPMAGNHLAIYKGRIFISEGPVLWWSEPFNFDLFNKAESFIQFHSNIRMIKPVSQGIFISTEDEIYFLSGNHPKEFVPTTVAEYPAIEWSEAIDLVEASEIGFEGSGLSALWATPEGAMLGLPSGNVLNINKEKIIYPDAARTGFGCLMGYNFIHGVK